MAGQGGAHSVGNVWGDCVVGAGSTWGRSTVCSLRVAWERQHRLPLLLTFFSHFSLDLDMPGATATASTWPGWGQNQGHSH